MDPTSEKEPAKGDCASADLSASALSARAAKIRRRVFIDCDSSGVVFVAICGACQLPEYEEPAYSEFPYVLAEEVGLKPHSAPQEISASVGNHRRTCCSHLKA